MQHPTAVPSATGAPWDQAPGPLASAGLSLLPESLPARLTPRPSSFHAVLPREGGGGSLLPAVQSHPACYLPPSLRLSAQALLLLPPLIAAHWPQSLRAPAPVEAMRTPEEEGEEAHGCALVLPPATSWLMRLV